MSVRLWRVAVATGGAVVGVSAAGVMAALTVRRRTDVAPAGCADAAGMGLLRSPGRAVIAEDGVPLHVEVDQPESETGAPTLVFVHGWALTQDSWHYQRARFRASHRVVLYDQRSHGRSGRSGRAQCSLERLGGDLAAVIEQAAGDGPLVLVGHSMGGMAIMSFAEQFPERMSERVAAVALLSTSAGRLLPLPGRRSGNLLVKASPPVLSALTTVAPAIEASRRLGGSLAYELTRRMGFGGAVSDELVAFVDAMIAANPVSVFTDFYPLFARLEMHEVLRGLAGTPTLVVAGSRDAVTPVRHSRRIAARIPTAELTVFARAGHLVMLERPAELNHLLESLLDRACP